MTHFNKSILLAMLSVALLTACGQSSTDTASSSPQQTSQAVSTTQSNPASASSPLLQSLAATYPNGQIQAANAAQAAKELAQNPAALKITAQSAPQTTQQAAQNTSAPIQAQATSADYKAVTRIQNTTLTGAYFFTIYDAERTAALAGNPNWRLEGPAFWASLASGTGLSPVHRFRNNINGSYLYTIYETEKADIQANYAATFFYEGVAWYAQQSTGQGWSPLYRFRNLLNGTYLFSAYEAEKDAIVANYSAVFKLEGIAYYVRQDAPLVIPIVPPVVPSVQYKLPDTGITNMQCYGTDSNALISCNVAAAITLSDRQDGMVGFDVAEPSNTDGKLGFSYEAVTGGCVKDKRTGLTWEVKTADGGLRDMNKTYTNYDDATKAQISGGGIPTLAQINAATNTVGFAAAVNATSLCGFSDWRLPTANELQGIVDYGALTVPSIDTTWFPNTVGGNYWSSSPSLVFSQYVWGIDFTYGHMSYPYRTAGSVRLVRGSSVVLAPRYSYSSDGSEVIDSKTGLTWQRCRVDWAWNGSACVGGFPAFFTHEQALAQAKTQAANSGKAWRLPNVKELSSIADVTQSPAVDKIAFPNTANNYWSSTPFVGYPVSAWAVNLNYGDLEGQSRGVINSVRLVRTTP